MYIYIYIYSSGVAKYDLLDLVFCQAHIEKRDDSAKHQTEQQINLNIRFPSELAHEAPTTNAFIAIAFVKSLSQT